MNLRSPVWLLLAVGAALPAVASERNAWPFRVDVVDDATDRIVEVDALGPLYTRKESAEGGLSEAWRPFMLKTQQGDAGATYFLYPLFTWRHDAGYRRFSFFDLVNDRKVEAGPGAAADRGFDVWPFYFSRETGDPATSYHALFPFAGTVRHRFNKEELTWYAFPLYFHTTVAGKEITSAPWPFVRVIRGAGHHGFELWPLFGSRERAGDYRSAFWLWPLGYREETNLSAPEPDVRLGALPFYARENGPGYLSETYAWPFFGYAHRWAPVKYDEHRYFWPFLVQGRGDDRYVNRWAPFYTHSVVKHYDKTWVLWPLLREAHWTERGLEQEKFQLLFFLYWSLEQSDPVHPARAPAAKRHFWPLYSAWDNGAGRRQFQLLSPLEVFFPHNDAVRELYTPLFALYRSDQRAPDDVARTFLWHLLSWRTSPAVREFHLGPLGWRRSAGEPHGRFFLFDFHPKAPMKTAEASPP